jgi:ABC-type branched-subunit amino acid transport system substrate-binding protein
MRKRVKQGGVVAVGAISALALLIPTVSAGASSSAPTSPGITKTTITVGQIDDLSQPVPGLFKAAEDGTKAYFDYVDQHGGVDGRKIVLDTRDSGYSTTTVKNEVESIATSDFAMVGGYSLLDGAEQPTIDANKLPDVTYPSSLPLSNDPHVYSPSPSTVNEMPTGPYVWAQNAFGDAHKSVGVLYAAGSAEAITAWNVMERAMKMNGFNITYQRGYSTSESTFNSDVLKMKAAGIKMYFDTQLPGIYAATLASETKMQNYNPVHIEGPAAYVSNMASASGGAANGMYIEMQNPLYQGEDAKAIPEVALFDKYTLNVDPKVFQTLDPGPSLFGWASGMLFVQALKAAGSNPTRAGLQAQLDKVTSFDANGLLPPGENPAKNVPSKCFIAIRLVNGKWTRVSPTPKAGYICDLGKLEPSPGFKPATR